MKKMALRRGNNKGFTLVELIVVIAIMAILVAIMIPQLVGYIFKAKRAKDAQAASVVKEATEYAHVFGDIPVNDSSFQPLTNSYFHEPLKSQPNLVFFAWNKSLDDVPASAFDWKNPGNFAEYTMAEVGQIPVCEINPDYIFSAVFDKGTAQCVKVYITQDPYTYGYDQYELWPEPSEYISHGPNR